MAIWHDILGRLDHPEVWGPGGLFPLEGFRRTGSGYVARCPNPAHPDRHPSFSMPRGKPFGYCFACGYRRGWIGYTMEQQGAGPEARGEPFWRALRTLAERAGIPLPDRRSPAAAPAPPADPSAAVRAAAAQYLRQALRGHTPVAERVRRYLLERGVAERHLPLFPLGALDSQPALVRALTAAGCAPRAIRATGLLEAYMARHSLIFIYGDGHEVTGFKGRVPDRALKEVKNAKGFGGELEARSLFGLGLADEAIATSGRVILVEGEFDCLTLQSALLREKGATVELAALGGTAKPTREKFRVLRELGTQVVYVAFDADPAGTQATAQALPLAWAEALDALVLPMPKGMKDPDEVLQTLGLERCLQDVFALARAVPGGEWLGRFLVGAAQKSPEGRVALRRRALEFALEMPRGELKGFLALVASAVEEAPEALEAARRQAASAAHEARVRAELSRWTREFQARLSQAPLGAALGEARARLDAVQAELDGKGR